MTNIEENQVNELDLKAYWVCVPDLEYGMYIHASTTGKAKSEYLHNDPAVDGTFFLDLRAWRVPALDGKPFTTTNLLEAGYLADHWDIENVERTDWLDWCYCYLCTLEKKNR